MTYLERNSVSNRKGYKAKMDAKNRELRRIEYFWKCVDVQESDECWLWNGVTTPNGYGSLSWDRKTFLAHRLSWILHNGSIPQSSGYHGTCVLHKCDNRRCVNPNHLFLGTHSDNMKDMAEKGRSFGPKRKLTKEQIAEIRKILSSVNAPSLRKIAPMYGVSYNAIWLIHHRLAYYKEDSL